MPYFRIGFHGKGIRLPCNDSDHAIGFFTTRVARAGSPGEAIDVARDALLAEWREGGEYAAANLGDVPTLTADSIAEIGLIRGFFGRKPAGYVFYLHDD